MGACFWSDTIIKVDYATIPEELHKTVKKIASNIPSNGITEKELVKKIRKRKNSVFKSLRILLRNGYIVRTGRGVKNSPFKYKVKE